MYCKNCAQEIDDRAVVCPHCGVAQSNPNVPMQPAVVDNGGFAWSLLGFCVPIAGLILFLVWKDTKPRTSKAAGVGALVGVIAGVVLYVISFAIGIMGAAMGGGY